MAGSEAMGARGMNASPLLSLIDALDEYIGNLPLPHSRPPESPRNQALETILLGMSGSKASGEMCLGVLKASSVED